MWVVAFQGETIDYSLDQTLFVAVFGNIYHSLVLKAKNIIIPLFVNIFNLLSIYD